METHLKIHTYLERNFFTFMPETPLSVFFVIGAPMLSSYKQLRNNYLYNITDYWQNPKGEIMIKFLELDHYIKFTEGNLILSTYIVQN